MKRKIKWSWRFFTSFICMLSFMSMQAQVKISGTVSDTQKEPLIGASVTVKGTTEGTITDINGNYLLSVPNTNATLIFSYIGYHKQEISLRGKTLLNVVLSEDVTSLEEVVVVGYGTQKRGSVTGAVSMVSSKEILKAPTMSVSNIVGARIAGISAVQESGQPGANDASLKVRGQDGVIFVIDGIRRTAADFNGIDPNEIESVSVLKDASAVAVYGLDANGAFIITTKKGKNEKMSISYTGSVGLSENTNRQEWLDGPGYAYWYNKARILDGDQEVFTAGMVQKMRDGVDGWGNTNWYDKVFKTGVNQHHNISASGGTEKIKFFASLGYLKDKGNIEKFDYDRFNLRSNIDAKLTRDLTFNLGISGRLETRNAPRYTADPNDWLNIPQQVIRALPYVQDKMEYEGKLYDVSTPTASSPVGPLAAINESGYSRSQRSYIQSNFSLRYDAAWLKGLSFKFQGAYDINFDFGKILTIPYKTMVMDLPNENTTNLTYRLSTSPMGNDVCLSEAASRAYNFTTQTSINFDRSFGKHTINVLALAETRENKSSALSGTGYGLDFIQLDELNNLSNLSGDGQTKYPGVNGYSGFTRVAGFVGRLNYDYANKYLLEASVRYDGSYLFGGMNNRWITLPGVSLGWRMNKEDWFNVSWVDNLKIRGGIGKTATSGVSPFQWANTMALAENSVIIGGGSQSMIYASVLGNPNLSWSQCLNYNFGFDATLWHGLLGMEFDVFYKYEWDRLSTIAGSYPPSMGGYYFSSANVNKLDYKGFDLTFTHNNKIAQFSYGAKLIWSYSFGRWLKFSGDSDNTPDYLKLTGKQIGSKVGLIATGLYKDQEDVDNSATVVGYSAYPGDIKYLDRDGNGEVSRTQDNGYVGRSSVPTHTGSLNLYGGWKGFDFDMLFSWGLGHDVALTGIYTSEGSAGHMDNTAFTKPFYHGGNSPTYLLENSWTPEHQDADFPRLSIKGGNNNNGIASTFWYKKGDYLRMKSAQIGYNFPQKWINPAHIEGLRLYIEGYNLFTLSGLNKYNIDPESPAVNNGYYPQQRTYSLGLKLTF